MSESATATYKLKLEQNASGAAEAAAKSLERLQQKIEGDQKALRQMQAAMKRLNGGTSVSIQAHKQLTDGIEKQKQKIAQSQARFIELGGTFDKVKAKTHASGASFQSAKAQLEKFNNGVESAGGPLAELLGKMKSVSGLAAGGLAAGLAIVAAATLAAAAGVAALTAKLIAYGFAAAGAARSQNLLLQAAENSSWWSRGGTVNLKGDAQLLDQIQSKYGGIRSELQGMDRGLRVAGLSGNNLATAMKAVAIAQSAGGTGRWSGEAIKQRMLAAAFSGQSLSRVLDRVNAKFGAIARQSALSLNNQLQTAHDMVAQLFRDVNIDPLLKGLHQVLGLFSQTTVTGKALHDLVTGLLNPLFKGAAKGTPILVKLFEYGVLYALKFGVAIEKAELSLLKFANAHVDQIKKLPALLKSLGTMAKYVGIGLGVMAAGLAAVGALLAGIVAIGAAVVVGFISMVGQFVSVGYDLITGLAHGIAKGAKAVWKAAKAVASGAVTTVQHAIRSHSPSLVFHEIGVNVSKGMALGIDSGSQHVDRSARAMVSIPHEKARKGGGGGGMTVNQTITVTGDAKGVDISAIRAAARQGLEDALEAAGNVLGGQLEPGAA